MGIPLPCLITRRLTSQSFQHSTATKPVLSQTWNKVFATEVPYKIIDSDSGQWGGCTSPNIQHPNVDCSKIPDVFLEIQILLSCLDSPWFFASLPIFHSSPPPLWRGSLSQHVDVRRHGEVDEFTVFLVNNNSNCRVPSIIFGTLW